MIGKRVVIITGGAGGIGGALATKYASEGDVVVLVDIDPVVGEQRVAEFKAEGKEAMYYNADITDETQCKAMIDSVVEKYGRIDVLHNNAGVLGKTHFFVDMPVEEFRNVLEINMIAAMCLSKYAARVMIEKAIKGVIINTSSLAGKLPNHEPIGYPVSKAAISMLTQATARELGQYGIRVVAMAPGWVRSIVKGGTVANPFERADVKELHMRNRVIEKEEVANVAYFLSTGAASGINGTTVMIDDGYTSFKLQTKLAER
ncbi:MAG: SDR family NAD(P)-dependent oxidoreductase [Lentihominibacter sp.]|jgi:NAD(P)-dependent dehydrogenase (short-subunit alcohol dehydrogenase family)